MKQKLFFLFGILICLVSCQKQLDSFQENAEQDAADKFNYNRFFPESQADNPVIKRVFEYLKNENSKKDFLSAFVRSAGYPRWDKVLLNKAVSMNNIVFANAIYNEHDTICVIPLVSENNTVIKGVLIAELLNGRVQCHYSLLTDYRKMGEYKEKFVLGMIQLEKLVFGHTSFKIYDHSVLGKASTILLRKRQDPITSTSFSLNTNDDPCEIVEIWHDPTEEECHCSGDEYYTGEWYYEGDCFSSSEFPYIIPLGGGSSYSIASPGPALGGTGGPTIPPYASTFTEKLNYLLYELDMTPESSEFLPTSEATVNEMYQYLYHNGSDERKEIASAHIQKMAVDADYLSLVVGYRSSTGGSITPWWDNQTWLSNPANFNLDITLENNQPDKLTAAEKALIAIYPIQAAVIKLNVGVARGMATATGLPDVVNGKQDAFRHAFFQAINTRDVPPKLFGPAAASSTHIVSLFAVAHESEVPVGLQLEKQMDLFNNNVGIAYCWNCFSIPNISIAGAIMTKLIAGELKYISPLSFSSSPLYDKDKDGIQDCPTCFNGIISASVLIPTNQ